MQTPPFSSYFIVPQWKLTMHQGMIYIKNRWYSENTELCGIEKPTVPRSTESYFSRHLLAFSVGIGCRYTIANVNAILRPAY